MPAGKPYASIGNAICAPDAAPIAQSSESDACYTDRDRHSAAFFAVNGIHTASAVTLSSMLPIDVRVAKREQERHC
jgi:hypothetical protein